MLSVLRYEHVHAHTHRHTHVSAVMCMYVDPHTSWSACTCVHYIYKCVSSQKTVKEIYSNFMP